MGTLAEMLSTPLCVIEWFVYLLTPLVFLAVARAPVGLALAAIVAFVAVMTFVRQAAGLGPWTEAAYDFGAFRALPSFVLGVVIAFGLDRVAARVSVGPWIGATVQVRPAL